MDITKLCKDAIRYRVKHDADTAKHGARFERWDAHTPLDALRNAGFDVRKTDTEWSIVRLYTLEERRKNGARPLDVKETVVVFPRKMSARKAYMTHYDVMPDMPRRIEV